MSQIGRIPRAAVERALLANDDPVDRQIFNRRCEVTPPCPGPCFTVQFPNLESSYRFVAALALAMRLSGVEDGDVVTLNLGYDLERGRAQQAHLLHFPGWKVEED